MYCLDGEAKSTFLFKLMRLSFEPEAEFKIFSACKVFGGIVLSCGNWFFFFLP